jgi:hypothetical protein
MGGSYYSYFFADAMPVSPAVRSFSTGIVHKKPLEHTGYLAAEKVCHWLCQCCGIVFFTALAEPVAHIIRTGRASGTQ